MRKTKIVCTIGPASESKEKLTQLIDAGMNVARLNFSHGDFEEHGARIQNIREVSKEAGKDTAILLDTKGPEIRTQTLEGDSAELIRGQTLRVSMTEVVGNNEVISVTYAGLVNDVQVGSKLLLDDGLFELLVTEIKENELVTEVLNSGTLKNKKGVNVPNVSVNLPGITDKDAADIVFGIEQDVDFIAASFVRRAADVLEIRELLEKHDAAHIHIIPKIENQEGVDNIEEILEVSDGLMVARGDLGVEIPPEEVPLVQKDLIKRCNRLGKPVITATQMLDSMQRNPRPTRAEASDVANAILDGTDAIMLSGETAAGTYPVESVTTMQNIALRAETAMNHEDVLKRISEESDHTITEAISQSVAHTAMNLNASAILTATQSGHTARMISKYRPESIIIAVTSNARVSRTLSLVWGVHAQMGTIVNSTDEMLQLSIDEALKTSYVNNGDLVVITAGVPVGEQGTTNLLKVHVIGEVIARGQGIGRKVTKGAVVVANSSNEALKKMKQGDILVTNSTDRDMIDAFEKAGAVITEQGGLTSHAAVVGLNLGIPVVVGVEDARNKFTEGERVTVDGTQGKIYKGSASIL